MVGAQQLRGELPALSGQPALHGFRWATGAGRRGGQGAGENGSVTAHHAGDVGDRSVGLAAATVPAGEDLPRPVRVGAEPGDRQIGALRGGFLPRPGVMPAARARPRHSGCRRECTGRRRCRHRLLSAGPSPDGGLVEVTVDSAAGNGEHAGDLGDGVLPGVIQPLGEKKAGVSPEDVLAAAGKQFRPTSAMFNESYSCPAVKDAVTGDDDLAAVLEQLTRAGLLRHVVKVQCPVCGLASTIALHEAVALPRCPGCGETARYAPQAGAPAVRFEATSLLVRAYTNGSLVPAAATVQLRAWGAYVLPGVNLPVPVPEPHAPLEKTELGGDGVRDLDLLGWRGQVLFTAEAKTDPAAFTKETLTSALRLSAHIGAQVLYLCCPRAIDNATVTLAAELAGPHGIRIDTMAGQTLGH